MLGLHGNRDELWILAHPAAIEDQGRADPVLVVPGGLDQDPSQNVLPALVIEPRRCCSPLERSFDTSPVYPINWSG